MMMDPSRRAALLQQLAHGLPAGALVVDPTGLVALANPRAAEILGRAPEQLEAARVDDVLVPFERLRDAPNGRLEIDIEEAEGTHRTLGITVAPLALDGEPGPPHLMCIFQDIGPFLQLRRERDRLLQLAAVSETLPSLVHELRNPLAAVTTTIELLLEEDGVRPVREELHAMLVEVRRALLALQGIGSVGQELRSPTWQAVDVALQDVARVLEASAARVGVRLRCEVPFLPMLRLDPSALRAVAFNLVNNAIAACAGGGEVVLTAELERSGPFRLIVADDGPGMPPEVLTRCTELFYTTKPHGSGIGLALCRRAAEQAGGVLRIDSGAGKGTRVTIEVPQ